MNKMSGIVSELLGGHIGIMLAPRARGLWFDPPTNLKYFFERILCHSSYSYYTVTPRT